MTTDSTQENQEYKLYENVYIARQPIFDINMNRWAYEILYRDRKLAKNAVFVDKLRATLDVLAGLPLCLALDEEECNIIINFPVKALLDQVQETYPASKIIIQLSDSYYPVPELTDLLHNLKNNGYRLSFSNFNNNPEYESICRLSDYITIDFLNQDKEKIETLIKIGKEKFSKSKFVAKRIEEYDDYIVAKDLGFNFFQGFFFKQPQICSGRKITTNSLSKFKILKLLQKEDIEFNEISEILMMDVSVVHRLLIYINSPSLGIKKRIQSIKEALVIMGLNPLKKWLQIIFLTDMKPQNKPHELVLLSAQRAYFLELLASQSDFKDKKNQLFLLGLFSLIDTILDQPKEILLSHLSLAEDLEKALLGNDSEYLLWLKIIEHCEAANWFEVNKLAEQLGINPQYLSFTYEKAYFHARNFFI